MFYYIGLDIGAVSVNAAVLDEKGEVVYVHPYLRHQGRPFEILRTVLRYILRQFGEKQIQAAVVTGDGRLMASKLLGVDAISDIKASWLGISHLIPRATTVIEIGGECAKLLCFEPCRGNGSKNVLRYFARNTLCAAGTGSFLDQQAYRLGYPIEEFGRIALKSESPSTISGRCSVFAKTDLIHLQQIGTPDYDMIAGLCFAVARNFLSSIGKARKLKPPVVFIGGVSANPGIVNAFRQLLKLKEDAFIIPQYYYAIPAIGAAVEASRLAPPTQMNFSNIMSLCDNITHEGKHRRLEPLQSKLSVLLPGHGQCIQPDSQDPIDVFLGVDVGSISTNLVLIDRQGRLVARRYLLTSGRPIEAVRQGLAEMDREVGHSVHVEAAATTGSGRYLIGDFIGADMVINEITAQAKAALHIDPDVDTIFEIGGQDSKFIVLEHGAVVDFAMNKVCAAGCGSFLEEQAEKMNISIKEEFSQRACRSQEPVDCGQRCTVFMESDLNEYLQAGLSKEDLTAGLAYSVVKNYLSNVADRRKIGSRIFFQGAVAYNRAVVAAFEKELGQVITVPANHDVTGAIGAALIARQNVLTKTDFRGFDTIVNKKYSLTSFTCKSCSNMCEIKKIEIEGRRPLYYGDRCDSRYQQNKSGPSACLPDLFIQREKLLFADYKKPAEKLDLSISGNGKKVGIPRALSFYDYLPQWKAFFSCLGYEVVVSDTTTKTLISLGSQRETAETCLPVKVCYGHILDLLGKKIDFLFLPVAVDQRKVQEQEERLARYNCPYVQAAPFIIKSGIDFASNGTKLLSPILFYHVSEQLVTKQLLDVGRYLGRSASQTKGAIKAAYQAQADFKSKLEVEGERVLNSLGPNGRALVIVGRPYNSCDSGLNLQVAHKIRQLGMMPIPMDLLPLSKYEHTLDWGNMYWAYGRKILTAAKIIAEDNRLHAVYITNFRCGPDSFILPFFKKIMGDKPFLQLEFDDHQADAGMVTRLEAFMDSISHGSTHRTEDSTTASRWPFVSPSVKHNNNRKVYIPYMGDYSYAWAAALKSFGQESKVICPDGESLRLGRRFTSGKECLPFVITAGSFLKCASAKEFDPSKAVFFMPTSGGPCRFGLYYACLRLILDELNLGHIEILTPNQGSYFYNKLGIPTFSFAQHIWKGMIAVEVLDALLRQTRPYEQKKGEAEKVYQLCLEDILGDLTRRKDPKKALIRARKAFSYIRVDKHRKRPFVGVIGEHYVRMNNFANDNVVKRLEFLGAEVLLSNLSEWIYHINKSLLIKNRMQHKWRLSFATWCWDKYLRFDEGRLKRIAEGDGGLSREPTVEEIWRNTGRYFLPWFGETTLGLGRAIHLVDRGVKGIVNVMPFTCLDGAISKTQLKRFQDDHPDVVVLNLEFDGQEESSLEDELESFMEQVKSIQA